METKDVKSNSVQAHKRLVRKGQWRWLFVLEILVLAIYIMGVRPFLATATQTNMELIVLGALLFAVAITLVVLLVTLVIASILAAWTRAQTKVAP